MHFFRVYGFIRVFADAINPHGDQRPIQLICPFPHKAFGPRGPVIYDRVNRGGRFTAGPNTRTRSGSFITGYTKGVRGWTAPGTFLDRARFEAVIQIGPPGAAGNNRPVRLRPNFLFTTNVHILIVEQTVIKTSGTGYGI